MHTVTLDHLFDRHTEPDIPDHLLHDLQTMNQAMTQSLSWLLYEHCVPPGWKCFRNHDAYYVVTNTLYPGRMFALFCTAPGPPCSFFTQVMALHAMRQCLGGYASAMTGSTLPEDDPECGLYVPDTKLIPLVSRQTIEASRDDLRPRMFALSIHVADPFTYPSHVVPQLWQKAMGDDPKKCWMFAKLCCLGFPVSTQFWTVPDSGTKDKLGLFTEVRPCVVLNDHSPDQAIMTRRHLTETNLELALLRVQHSKPFRHVLKVALHELETMESQAGRTFRFLKKEGLFGKPLAEQRKALWWIKNDEKQ